MNGLGERFFADLDRRIAGTHPQPTPQDSRERLALARPYLWAWYDMDPEGFERDIIRAFRVIGEEDMADALEEALGMQGAGDG